MERPTDDDITEAIVTLVRSDRGRQAISDTLAMLDNGGISLDGAGQHAVLTLIIAAFTTHPGSARDAMREAVTR